VPADLAALLVHDGSFLGAQTVPLEERPVVVAGQEAGLLALGARGDGEARARGLRPGRLLALVAEGEPETLQVPWVERREHVRLVLLRIGRPGEQEASVPLDDPCVMSRRELRRARPAGEGEQLVEAEVTVAADAGIRCLTARVAVHEGLHDGVAELLAQVERHVRQTQPVAGLAGRDDGGRRAARALGVGSLRIEPQAERDPDRLRACPEERDGAVDAAAHRDRHPLGVGRRAEDAAQRRRERVHGERLTAH
jgi:hypothetical protein